MTSLLPLFQASPIQVLSLHAVVLPKFTRKRQVHYARNKRMTTNTHLNLPDKLLEIALQNGLNSLEDFTLQMAYATTSADTQFEILSIGGATDSENSLPEKPAPLTLAHISTTSNTSNQ